MSMWQLIAGVLLLVFVSCDTFAAPVAPEEDDTSIGPAKCAEFQRDTVAQSVRSAQFIDEHVEIVPPQEQKYLETGSAASTLSGASRHRFLFVIHHPLYNAWRLHNSLRELIHSLQSIDEPSPGANPDTHRVKKAAFALVSVARTGVLFEAYSREDRARPAPVMDDATFQVASVSLAEMAPALAWFISCTADAMESRKK
ncbi:hypothetical protein [Paraburkholderia sp. BL10I2N1]|uniref:hypothetical protein n=1 Tax=Paraburkholderia sp. BL10I2N1 TaxID=1938796 RepID=UPI001415260B|nr:hypothetical protein [Paraburkholderia sp. BL10I2N1]